MSIRLQYTHDNGWMGRCRKNPVASIKNPSEAASLSVSHNWSLRLALPYRSNAEFRLISQPLELWWVAVKHCMWRKQGWKRLGRTGTRRAYVHHLGIAGWNYADLCPKIRQNTSKRSGLLFQGYKIMPFDRQDQHALSAGCPKVV